MTSTFDWFNQLRTRIGGSDLKAEFDTLMSSIGIPCFIRRSDTTVKCSCLKATGEPDPLCNDCGGLGFEYEDHPGLVRFVETTEISEEPIEIGGFDQTIGYLSTDTLFKRIDQIIEVQITQDGQVIYPFLITKIHAVKEFREMRGDDRAGLVYYRLKMGETQRGDVKF